MRSPPRKPRSLLFYLTAAGALGSALLPGGTLGQTPGPTSPIEGLAAWDKIARSCNTPAVSIAINLKLGCGTDN